MKNNKSQGAWNATLKVTMAYFDPKSHTDLPVAVRVEAESLDMMWSSEADIPLNALTASTIKSAFPLLRLTGATWSNLIDEIMEQLYRGIGDGSVCNGYIFTELGWVTLPNGAHVRVCGDEIIGEVGKPYFIAPSVKKYHIRGMNLTVAMLVPLLLDVQLPALMVLAFVLLASVRSILPESSIEFQGVMLLEGKQGLGKTTVATRVGAICESTDARRATGVVQLGSTFASIRDAFLTLRDAVVILDDLCISASSAVQRRSLDVAAKTMRFASGTIPLTKKAGDETKEVFSQAMGIITAEYSFDKMSDLTRCIIVPVKEQLHLPDALNPELAGAVVHHFSAWIAEHHEAFVDRMKAAAHGDAIPDSLDQRIRTNYGILLAVWDEFLRSLKPAGVDSETELRLHERFEKALDAALTEHATLIENLRANEKRGNLAYVILGALANDVLKPGKRVLKDNDERLERYQERGCLRLKHHDIGVDPEVLLQIIRAQPGYHDATRNSIVRELKDIAALRLQRNGQHTTNMVKLWDGGPWGYRISLDVLEDEAEEF